MKYVDYLRKVEKCTEETVDRRMKDFHFEGSYEDYIRYCKDQDMAHEPVEEIIFAVTWQEV